MVFLITNAVYVPMIHFFSIKCAEKLIQKEINDMVIRVSAFQVFRLMLYGNA